MNHPLYQDIVEQVQGFSHRLAMLEITLNAYGERLDLIEQTWEVLLDKVEGTEEGVSQIRERIREKFATIDANIITLRDDILGLQGTRPPGYEEAEKELLDEIPEFESIDEVETYAKEELAKGGRAAKMRKWLDDPENYRPEFTAAEEDDDE